MKKGMLILLAVFGLPVPGCTETTKTSVTVSFDSNGGQGSMKGFEKIFDFHKKIAVHPNGNFFVTG